MVWKMPWSRRGKLPTPELGDDEIRQILEFQLLRYACLYQQREGIGALQEVRVSTPDLYVKINGKQIAYIHQWYLRGNGKIMVVEHFAVEKEFTGRGLGTALARGLAKALQDEFETETIVLSERSYSAEYERFFKRLGAVPRDSSLYPGKPDWIWSLVNTSID